MLSKEHYQAGRLKEALAAATDEVKKKPGDVAPRLFLSELLLFAGDMDRADVQLDTVSQQEPKWAIFVALLRQLIRAEKARRQFYEGGRLPEFLRQPSEDLRLRLEASIRIREGNLTEAMEFLQKAEAGRARFSGTLDGQDFDDFRDLDDLTSSFLEVLTATGKYYWVSLEEVAEIEMEPPGRPSDLIWRSAKLSVQGGPGGVVYLPALYAGSHSSDDPRIRLGRVTTWQGEGGAPVRGLGQRTFLAGERDVSILEICKLQLRSAEG